MRDALFVFGSAIVVGFVSVLVYHVSASDGLGLGQRSMTARSSEIAEAEGLTPIRVEFIVQQCDPTLPDAIQSADLRDADEPAPVPEPPITRPVTPDIPIERIAAEAVPESVPKEAASGGAIQVSPSIIYIQ